VGAFSYREEKKSFRGINEMFEIESLNVELRNRETDNERL